MVGKQIKLMNLTKKVYKVMANKKPYKVYSKNIQINIIDIDNKKII